MLRTFSLRGAWETCYARSFIRSSMLGLALASGILLILPAHSYGEDEGLKSRVEELEKRQEVLEEELITLKSSGYATRATEPYLGMGPAASKVYRVEEGVSLAGYGEMLYEAVPGKDNRLDFLRLITYIGYRFEERFLFNSEIEIEHAAVEPGERPGELAVEFAYLEYAHADWARLRGGLLLVPMGFINEQHEPVVFLSAKRPRTETLIIPTTFRENGVGLLGNWGILGYKLYLLNGLNGEEFSGKSGYREGRQAGAKALANRFMGVGNLSLTPLAGLKFEGSLLRGNVNQNLAGLPSLPLLITEIHGEYRFRGLWLRGLIATSSFPEAEALNEERVEEGLEGVGPSQVTTTTEKLRREGIGSRPWGGYLEIGYNILELWGSNLSLTPYLRWERVDTQAGLKGRFERNPAYRQTLINAGINFKPIPQLVLKGEVEWVGTLGRDPGKDPANYYLNLGYVF